MSTHQRLDRTTGSAHWRRRSGFDAGCDPDSDLDSRFEFGTGPGSDTGFGSDDATAFDDASDAPEGDPTSPDIRGGGVTPLIASSNG